MPMHSALPSYIYENLQPLARFNRETRLCVYEPTHKLYIVKSADRACKPIYEAVQSLNSPHLAKVLAIVDADDHIEIVREYISGDTLADLLKGHHPLSADRAVKIAAEICDGLYELHGLGLVHRDITPNNILISQDGCARIIDFGIARSFAGNKKTDTAILGTPGYAAPEQFGFSQSDARTDIYAVGVLLNVMLTGYLPNEQTVKGSLGKIIQKCIEIDSRHRYNNMRELKSALDGKAQSDTPMDRALRQIPGLRSRHIPVVILACIGYVCAILFSVAIFATAAQGTLLATGIAWVLMMVVPFFCFHNFLDIRNKLPFSKGASPKNQRIVYTALGVLSMLFGLILFGLSNSP